MTLFGKRNPTPPIEQPNFDTLMELPPNTIISELPPDFGQDIDPAAGERILYRTACLGRLGLNLALGKNEINAGSSRRKNYMYFSDNRKYPEWMARSWPNSQLRGDHEEQLRTIIGKDFARHELPRIVMAVTVPETRDLRVAATSRSDGTAFKYHGPLGFEAIDEHSRQAMEELFQMQLPRVENK